MEWDRMDTFLFIRDLYVMYCIAGQDLDDQRVKTGVLDFEQVLIWSLIMSIQAPVWQIHGKLLPLSYPWPTQLRISLPPGTIFCISPRVPSARRQTYWLSTSCRRLSNVTFKGSCYVIIFIWRHHHSHIIMMVADGLAPVWRHAICNHHGDVCRSTHNLWKNTLARYAANVRCQDISLLAPYRAESEKGKVHLGTEGGNW